MRVITSVPPPAVNGTTMRICAGGKSAAAGRAVEAAAASTAAASADTVNLVFMASSSLFDVDPQVEHHDGAGHAQRGNLDRRERHGPAGQVPLPRPPGAAEPG